MPDARIIVALLAVTVLAGTAHASPIRLDYIVTPQAGDFLYEFTFVADNNDGSWAPGQSFRWFVFGDAPSGQTSPLTAFAGDPNSFVNSPYTGFGRTSGGHNGPDLQPVLTDWIPANIGDSFSFSGTSTADLQQGQLLWSNVTNGSTNPGVRADFEVAQRVPEPGALALLAVGALALLRRR
jgi:MYXO-CTERM domain-containing protein